MSNFFVEKLKVLKKKCCCKILESLYKLAFLFQNKPIYTDKKEFHNEKSYPT